MRADLYQIEKQVSEGERILNRLEAEILDLQQCLAGNSSSERWKSINIELASKKGELFAQREYDRVHSIPGVKVA